MKLNEKVIMGALDALALAIPDGHRWSKKDMKKPSVCSKKFIVNKAMVAE